VMIVASARIIVMIWFGRAPIARTDQLPGSVPG
jgi:hypothetical protein